MVRYREIRPSEHLRTFVETFWILEHDGHDVTPQRVVPDGRSELILNWDEPFEFLRDGRWHRQPRCLLAGQIDGPLLLRPSAASKVLGIRFHPHGAARVLSPPMQELRGEFTSIDALSPAFSRDLTQALESRDPIALVEAALVAAEGRSRDGDLLVAEAVRRIVLAQGGTDLAALARDLSLSVRQLERRFHSAVGLPPKLFARIERFSNIFRAFRQQSTNWADTAAACGYYDQSHLIRDFRDFSAETPVALLSEETDLARHFYLRFGMSHSSRTRGRRLG